MVDAEIRILVVGAGTAGLAAVRALQLNGFTPELVERLPASTVAGAGIFLPGNVAPALADLGLIEPLRRFGEVITRHQLLDIDGGPLWTMDLGASWGGVGECRGMSRADLHRVLLAGVGGPAPRGPVRNEIGVAELTVEDSAAGSAEVGFTDGSRGGYDLVVGADGRRSTVRALAGIGGAAVPSGQLVFRFTVDAAVVSDLDPGTRLTMLGDRASLTVTPIGGGRVYCHLEEVVDAEVRAPADPVARVRGIFGGFGPPAPALLAAAATVAVAVIDRVGLERWSRGPVVLVGDAAHGTPPGLSQGAATALEDAIALGSALRAEPDVPAALAAYEQARRPRVQMVCRRTESWADLHRQPRRTRDVRLRESGDRLLESLLGPPGGDGPADPATRRPA